MPLFEVTENDRKIYEGQIKDFLPDRIIDIHTHVWKGVDTNRSERNVSWPARVAPHNPIEDITEAYKLFFPGKTVTPLIFGNGIESLADVGPRNDYVVESMKRSGYPALYYCHPEQTADEVEREIFKHGFLGIKSYLSLSPAYIPTDEIRIFDFFPPHILEMINKNKLMVMLHIPRSGRLRDPVNVEQIKMICEKYPDIRLVIAHVGRAYCKCDVGNAFEELKDYKDLCFDFTANCNPYIFEQMLGCVSTDRIMFGSDEPILRMRCHRIEEDGRYVNIIPKGLYGDVSGDKNMREVSGAEADAITFFMYEEIIAMKTALAARGMGKEEAEKLFFSNADKLIRELKTRVM